jgi:hypothetical protein
MTDSLCFYELSHSLLAEVSICAGKRRRRDLCQPLPGSDTFSVAHVHKLPWQRVIFITWYQTGFCGSNLVIQRLNVVWRQTNYLGPIKQKRLLSFVLLSLLSQFHLWKYQLYRVYKKKVIELQRAIVSELLCVWTRFLLNDTFFMPNG